MPFCTISAALAASGAEALLIIHALNDSLEYAETNAISKPVAIFAFDGGSPLLRGAGNNPALNVLGNGDLFLRGLTIQSGQSNGISVTGSAWIEKSSIVDNGGVGVILTGGSAWIESSSIINNTGGGILLDGGGSLVLTNSFVGGEQNDQRAVSVTDGAATILYSTLAAGFGTASALSCTDGTNTTVRNSMLVARTADDELDCPNATISASALELDIPGNTALGPMPDTSWFTSYANGDFHLTPAHPAAIDTAGLWQSGDPTTDIDGAPRPTIDQTPDVAGADIP